MAKRKPLAFLEIEHEHAPMPDEKGQGETTLIKASKKYKHTSLYLPDGARKQLRELAYTEEVKQHDLILEAIDLLFKARGRKSIKELEE